MLKQTKEVEMEFSRLGEDGPSLERLALWLQSVAEKSLNYCIKAATEFCPFLDGIAEIHSFKMQPVSAWETEVFGMTATVCILYYFVDTKRKLV